MLSFIVDYFKKKDTFYWKYIDLDIDLVEEVREIYLKNLPDYSKGTSFFQCLDLKLPLIKGRRVLTPALIYTAPNANTGFSHKDPVDHINGSSAYALNIPLINCENSKTILYKDKNPILILPDATTRQYVPKEVAVIEAQSNYKAKVITSYVLNRPILFNTRIFHGIQNYSPKPRLAISLRFDRNPVEWL